MVNSILVLILLAIRQTPNPTFDELFPKTPPPPISDVRIISTSNLQIKPCQGITLVFDIGLRADALRTQWPRVARDVSRLVRLNGRDCRNKLSEGSTNSICAFDVLWPVPEGREPPLKASSRALVSASCQIDAEARTCLFTEPGDYHFEFFFGNQTLKTTVHVLAPTSVEQPIVEKLNSIPILLLMAEPKNPRYATRENIAALEPFLRTPTAYSDIIALTIGIAESQRVGKPLRTELTAQQWKEELEHLYGLLKPVLRLKPDSKLVGVAAFQLAGVSSQLERISKDEKEKPALAGERDVAFQLVANCPLVPSEQAMATQALTSIRMEEQSSDP